MSPRSHASGMSGGRSHVSLISAPGVALAAQAGSTTADRRPGADGGPQKPPKWVVDSIPTNIAPAQHPFQAAMPPAPLTGPQTAVSGSAKKQAADGGLVSSGTALPDTADTRPDQGQEPNVLTQSSSSDVFFERIPTPSHNYVAIEQAEEMLREMELKYKKDRENMDVYNAVRSRPEVRYIPSGRARQEQGKLEPGPVVSAARSDDKPKSFTVDLAGAC